MLVGLRSEDGTFRVTWDDLDLSIHTEHLGPADAALLAALKAGTVSRANIDPRTVSASEAEKGIRQMALERLVPYYLPPSALVSGLMGTVRHAATFDESDPDFIVERRFADEWGSAQLDTFHIPTGTLSDLKTIGWYKVKMMLTKGIMQEGASYVWQVNRQRQLLEASTPYHVEHQHLMIVPQGIMGRVKDEAKALGVEYGMVRMEVPRIADDEVVAHYREKAFALGSAMDAGGAAPYCTPSETWNGKKCLDCRYCPVNRECWTRSQNAGETHPYLKGDPNG